MRRNKRSIFSAGDDVLILLSTFPDLHSAKKVAKELVKNKICACVSILKIETSIYRWKGKIVAEPEFLAVVKLSDKNYARAENTIKKMHPYEVPEIVAFKANRVNNKYRAWVERPQ